MNFNILTLFPEVFEPYLNTSIIGRGRDANHLTTNLYNIRDYATDRHKTVDDTPYGGGAGMVMKVEPIDKALQATSKHDKERVIVMAARGKQFTQRKAEELAELDSVTFICGRYEGIDQRVADHLADEELSIGPYVLAGGELASLVIMEAVARLIPGVLGNPESLADESYNQISTSVSQSPTLEYPQYTKPASYRGWDVPEVLLSGNHEAIKQWKINQKTIIDS